MVERQATDQEVQGSNSALGLKIYLEILKTTNILGILSRNSDESSPDGDENTNYKKSKNNSYYINFSS